MRTFVFAVLGLIAGLLVGMALTEVLASFAVSEDGTEVTSLPLAVLIGLATPALGIVGAVGAIFASRGIRHRRDRAELDERLSR